MNSEKKFLDTKETVEYLAEHGVRRTHGTLECLRVRGGGPRFHKAGRQVVYSRLELDKFIASIMSGALSTTHDD